MTIVLNGTTGITDVNGTAAAPAITGTDTDSGMYFGTNTVSLATGGTAAVIVDSSQNVAITGTATATKLIPTGTSVTGNGMYLPATNSVGISTAGTNAFYINASQLVGVGTTSPTAKLSVLTSTAAQYSGYFSCVNTGYGIGIQCTNGGSVALMYFFSSAYVGDISTNGTTTSFNSASDYRLKENILPMTGALAKVLTLKPITYKWKSDGSDGQGFIAHELQEVIPDAVTGEKDAVDEKGDPKYQGVDTSFLVATLTAAIQEQQALITSLTDRIAALEAR